MSHHCLPSPSRKAGFLLLHDEPGRLSIRTHHKPTHAILSTRNSRCLNHSQVCNSYLYPIASTQIPTFTSSDMSGEPTKIPSHMLTSPSRVGSGATTPRHETSRRGASKRKQTLLSLLDALNELTNDEETFPKGKPPPAPRTCARIDASAAIDSSLQPNFQDDRDVREWLYCAANGSDCN